MQQSKPLCCGVFSCQGLGDGLIALVLSNNLRLNGHRVETFHPFLKGLQEWFPSLLLKPFPQIAEMEMALKKFDRFFIIYEKTEWMKAILDICQQRYPERTVVLNPIATRNRDYPYWEQGKFDGAYPFVDNLYWYCQKQLGLPVVTKSNGIACPETVQFKRYPHRVVLHPKSSREGKNWPIEKFIQLAFRLKKEGWDPAFILTREEREQYSIEAEWMPIFQNIHEMAIYISESGFMIGNDSGIGHLASCLGLSTVTICRNRATAEFWRPAWSRGEIVAPSRWIPNLKGLRLRDQHWKKWVTVQAVLSKFERIQASST